jgi:hypothetical protein
MKRKCCRRDCVNTRIAFAATIAQLKQLNKTIDLESRIISKNVLKMRKPRRQVIGWSRDKYGCQP